MQHRKCIFFVLFITFVSFIVFVTQNHKWSIKEEVQVSKQEKEIVDRKKK